MVRGLYARLFPRLRSTPGFDFNSGWTRKSPSYVVTLDASDDWLPLVHTITAVRTPPSIRMVLSVFTTTPIMYARHVTIVVIRSSRIPRDTGNDRRFGARARLDHNFHRLTTRPISSRSRKGRYKRIRSSKFFKLSFKFPYMKCYIIYIGYFPSESNCLSSSCPVTTKPTLSTSSMAEHFFNLVCPSADPTGLRP